MAYKSDIESAREAQKRPIQEIGDKLGIPSEHLLPFGHDKAKVSEDFIKSLQGRPDGKLVLEWHRKDNSAFAADLDEGDGVSQPIADLIEGLTLALLGGLAP